MPLEVSWEALEHAGVPPRGLAGSDTAVLMGVNSDDYGKLIMEDLPGIEAWTGIGTSLCGVANRVSHLLDLRGPSVALDAACAASLVAVHQACQLLRAGETSLALAGGVSALIGPGLTRVLDVAGATAARRPVQDLRRRRRRLRPRRGRGRRGAQAARPTPSATVTGCWPSSAAVRWPRTAAPSASCRPTATRRRTMFRRACRTAGVAPASVDFVEAHGTGTPTGDPWRSARWPAVYGVGPARRTSPARSGRSSRTPVTSRAVPGSSV